MDRMTPEPYFNAFKLAFLQYFSNNNSINWLANTFTTIKQKENKAADYFTAPQILNQFIRSLYSSILHCICSMHPANFQATVTNARDFEATKLEANYAQAINLVINRSSELDSKLKQFIMQFINLYNNAISKKMRIVSRINHVHLPQPINSGSKRCMFATTVLPTQPSTISTDLSANNATANISIIYISTSSLSTAATSNISTTATTNYLLDTHSLNTAIKPSSNDIRKLQIKKHPKLEIGNSCSPTDPQFIQPSSETEYTQNPSSQNYLSLLVTPEDTQPHNLKTNQQLTLTKTTYVSLFSGATLNTKPITAMYTDAKVDGHIIKLILNSRLAGSIITQQLIDQLGCQVDCAASARIITTDRATKIFIGKIDDFFFEVNSIIIPIKVLVMEATQYQALPKWLTYTCTSHVWPLQTNQSTNTTHRVRRKREKTYLRSIPNYNELPPILSWDNHNKKKQKETKLTWNTDQAWKTDNGQDKLTLEWKEDNNKEKRKEKEKETTPTNSTYSPYAYTLLQPSGYH
ncbi:hypothetical protein G9A89_009817 [Geosiphon pyriformis]|nr:hypothetical protein G9A89_009817 [Geosiphon pyriformis]